MSRGKEKPIFSRGVTTGEVPCADAPPERFWKRPCFGAPSEAHQNINKKTLSSDPARRILRGRAICGTL